MLEKNLGYSLVELLTVVSVFGVLAVTSTNLFFSSVVGSSKESVVREVKQSGDYAVVQIENILRNAKRIEGCNETPTLMDQIVFVDLEDDSSTISIGESGQKEGKLLFDGEELLSGDVAVVQGEGMEVVCSTDASTGVTSVRVAFELEFKAGDGGDPYSEMFIAAVTLRNRY